MFAKRKITLKMLVIIFFFYVIALIGISVVEERKFEMVAASFTNYTENIGNFVEVEISYDADVEEAIRIMRKVCAGHELTLNTDANAVTASGYTQNGITLKTTIWTENLNDSFQACSDIRIALVSEFKKSGIEIPYQTVTVNSPFHT